MTAIARFEVIPVREGSMVEPIARAVDALERYDVTYETTPTDTVVEADTLEELFAAVRGAHEAIADERRVVTELEIDYQPDRPRGLDERVRAVERELGRPPRNQRGARRGGQEPSRYEGGRRGRPYGERQVPAGTAGGRAPGEWHGSDRRYGSRPGSRW